MRPSTLPVLCLIAGTLAMNAAEPSFAPHTIGTGLRGGYQVIAADVNADGRPDLIALASGLSELLWYENPGPGKEPWPRHVIVTGQTGMINVTAADLDGDRIPELLLASGFAMIPSKSAGTVQLLHHNGDVRQPWSARQVDALTTSHRLRVARVNGKTIFINAPLAGGASVEPAYRDAIPVVWYDPATWTRHSLTQKLHGVLHGIFVYDWDGNGSDDVLTASFEGIDLFESKSGAWSSGKHLSDGFKAEWPAGGSSDIAIGTLAGQRFIAAIEPWHGPHVAIYTKAGGTWQRNEIDATAEDGHTILTADFDGDGNDEVIAGFRKTHHVRLYHHDPKTRAWAQTVIDSGIGAAGCIAADFNADKRLDFACIGTSSADLKWYENTTAPSR
jgi:hypothetical protein